MHLEAIPEAKKSIWPKLPQFGEFYLAGGTALALQIGHRVSVDFDLFSPDPLERSLLPRVEKIFSGLAIKPLINNRQELTLLIDQIKVTFLHYPFPLLTPLVEKNGLRLLSVAELAATKAYTIGRRGSFKDYVDLYFVLSESMAALPQIMDLAERKYEAAFNPRMFLEQLVYLDDVTDTQIQFLKPRVSQPELQTFFEAEIKKIRL